jgi:hypothetical protein
MISGPTALLASKVEIISKISCSLTIICERTFLHLTSKEGRSLFLNRVNNLKKQAKELFYANINENLDELKTTDSKMYWKTIHMLIKNERSVNNMPPLRDRDDNFK